MKKSLLAINLLICLSMAVACNRQRAPGVQPVPTQREDNTTSEGKHVAPSGVIVTDTARNPPAPSGGGMYNGQNLSEIVRDSQR